MNTHTKTPQLEIDEEFKGICQYIAAENKTIQQWEEIKSDDMYQTEKYCGGFDGIEQEFTFSYMDKNNQEWWFQLPLSDIERVVKGELQFIDLWNQLYEFNC